MFVVSYCMFAMIEDYISAFRSKEESDRQIAFKEK